MEFPQVAKYPSLHSRCIIREGKGGDITITRTGGTTTSQTLRVKSSDGRATTADDDDAAIDKTITFAKGETSTLISVSTTADFDVEKDESFGLTITAEGSDEVPPQISDGTATVTIKADDFKRGDSLYTIVDGPSWTEAESNAQRIGGNLVTINNSEEDAYIQSSFKNNIDVSRTKSSNFRQDGLWIGLSDYISEGQWRWSSGQAVTYKNPRISKDDAWCGQDFMMIKPVKYGDFNR